MATSHDSTERADTSDASDPVVVEALQRTYNADRPEIAVHAVDGVSFSIGRGQSVAIIGPSGCGKSTLLNLLGCLDRPTAGVYRLEGRDVAERDEDELAALRNRHIGFVFQTFNLLPRMNALENVELPLLYAAAREPALLAARALERVGLADRAHHMPGELSGGQKQRVAVARAIVTEPSILLCDEPTGALDSRTSAELMALLHQLCAEGTTLLVVTHDLQIARTMQRALHMRDGRIVDDGPAADVVDAYLARYLTEEATAPGASPNETREAPC